MLREEQKIKTVLVELGGIESPAVQTTRKVAKSFTQPAVGNLTVESYIHGEINQLKTYVRTELTALPTTVFVQWGDDKLWGRVKFHRFLQRGDTALPDVSEAYDGRFVLGVQDEPLVNGIARITITTVAAITLTIEENPVDEETGLKYTLTKVYTLSATKPTTAASVNAEGVFTTVERVSHNLYLATTKPATMIPIGETNALEWTTLDAIVWPDVLESYVIFTVVDSGLEKVTDLLATKIRDAFAGDVKVIKRLWWQSTPYDITVPEQMQPAGIQVEGNLKSFTIRPTLHSAFVYTEQNFLVNPVVASAELGAIEFSFGPTKYTDWVPTLTKTQQNYRKGGYLIEQSIFNRPEDHLLGSAELSVREVTNPYSVPYYSL